MIWLLVNRAIKGKCKQAIRNSKCRKGTEREVYALFTLYLGVGERNCSTFHTWAAHNFLVTASMSPLDNSVECQCHVRHTNFYSSSYSCTSSSRSVHILGSSGKTSGESSIVWISFSFFLYCWKYYSVLVGWLVGFFPIDPLLPHAPPRLSHSIVCFHVCI